MSDCDRAHWKGYSLVCQRKIRAQGFESEFSWHELPSELVLDGIFISSKGERIAFEIETTPGKKVGMKKRRWVFKCDGES